MPADMDEIEVQEESPKEKKKREKQEKKEAKLRARNGGFDAAVTDDGTMYLDAEEDDEEGSVSMALITMFIVIIWLAILCLLIKLDVGGFGSGVLYPVLKNVPVINKILPEVDVYTEDDREFKNLNEALKEIERLREENLELREAQAIPVSDASEEEIAQLKEEIARLRTFEDSQIEFQKLKTEFYEEIVFADNAPSIENYKAYYESIDPENAEYLYKQVVSQLAEDKEIKDYVKTYTDMKPKNAAAVFEQMTDNLELVASILDAMDATSRAKILNVMDPVVASQLTKIMNPD